MYNSAEAVSAMYCRLTRRVQRKQISRLDASLSIMWPLTITGQHYTHAILCPRRTISKQ